MMMIRRRRRNYKDVTERCKGGRGYKMKVKKGDEEEEEEAEKNGNG